MYDLCYYVTKYVMVIKRTKHNFCTGDIPSMESRLQGIPDRTTHGRRRQARDDLLQRRLCTRNPGDAKAVGLQEVLHPDRLGARVLDEEARRRWNQLDETLAASGLRVLALASTECAENTVDGS